MEQTQFDDMTLNAFVDNQVDPAMATKIIQAMEDNAEIRERVYQLRRAKDLMKLSFKRARAPVKTASETRDHLPGVWRLGGIAASILMLVIATGSATVGYYAGKQQNNLDATTLAQHYQDRLVLHVSESNPKHFARALAFVKTFLAEHEQQGGGQIEVVANTGGLDLLRKGVSPYEQEVKALMKKHANVHFIACANGIRRLFQEGIEPNIIDGVPTDETAFDHIVGRLQAGWSYIKVQSLDSI